MTDTITIGPPNARTDPTTGLRTYRWRGVDYPSVTSVRRLAGVPHGLVAWQLNQVIRRATEQHDELTAMLTRERRPRERVLESNRVAEAGRWLRSAAVEERDRSAALGTAVHDCASRGMTPDDVPDVLAFADHGRDVEIPGDLIRPRLAQYRDWLAVSGATIVGSEFQCFSPSIGYAGTCDILARFPAGAVHVVDIKTGQGIYAEHAMQVMAYAMADLVGRDDEVDAYLTDELRAHTGLGVLHLADDGWEYVVLRRDPATWDAFRGLLTFATWMAAHPDAASITAASRRSGERDITNARIAAAFDATRGAAA